VLRAAALKDPSFVHYISTEQAQRVTNDFIVHMQQFRAQGEKRIIPDKKHASLEKSLLDLIKNLHFPNPESKKMSADIALLTSRIQIYRVDDTSKSIIDSYIRTVDNRLRLIGHNVEQLNTINAELTGYLVSVKNSQPLMKTIRKLLAQIKACQVYGYEHYLIDYILAAEANIKNSNFEPVKLNSLKNELLTMLPAFKDAQQLIEGNRQLIAQIKEFKVGAYEQFLITHLNKAETKIKHSKYDPLKLAMITSDLRQQLNFVKYGVVVFNENIKLLNQINQCRVAGYDENIINYLLSAEADIKINKYNLDLLITIKRELTIQLELSKKSKALIEENIQLLQQMELCKVSKEDKLLSDYIKATEAKIKSSSNDPEKLESINKNIKAVLDSVTSSEVQGVKSVIKSLRASVRIYTAAKSDKAAKVEKALCETPLLKRRTVLSQRAKANPVQEAIALHRVRGKTYKTNDSRIDLAKAPKSYKKLMKQYDGVVHIKPKDVESIESERRTHFRVS
jgi:hypothetical protein